MLCACVADAGGRPVVVGGRPERRELAAHFGGTAGSGEGADVVIEAAGTEQAWHDALGLVRPGGTVLFFGGLPRETPSRVDSYRLHYEELTLRGAFHHTPRDRARGARVPRERRLSLGAPDHPPGRARRRRCAPRRPAARLPEGRRRSLAGAEPRRDTCDICHAAVAKQPGGVRMSRTIVLTVVAAVVVALGAGQAPARSYPTAVEYSGRWQGFFDSSVTGEIGTFTLNMEATHNRQLDGTLSSPTLPMSLPFHVTVGESNVFTAVSPGGNFVVHGTQDAGFMWFEHADYRLRQGGGRRRRHAPFLQVVPGPAGAVQLPSVLDGRFSPRRR